MAKSKDLFEESSMSFGEHLEVLRVHLIRALIGLVLACCVTFFYGQELVQYISQPIKNALKVHYEDEGLDEEQVLADEAAATEEGDDPAASADESQEETDTPAPRANDEIEVSIKVSALAPALHEIAPEQFPEQTVESDKVINVKLKSEKFRELNSWQQQQKALARVIEKQAEPVTREVHEAFMVYLKVSVVAGLVLASPWIIYQLWLFVAAGLYPTERKYVYYSLPFSVGLFLTGVFFCFYVVLPYVLAFLLSFNDSMGVSPQIFLREWISFAIMLPVMFGISFQLPLVMLVLERISICSVETYREKRRIAILIIAVVSMLMTPSDPQSMIAMMIPLTILYELGIIICTFRVNNAAEPDSI